MVTATDMKRLTERWARMVHHLHAHDIKYGIDLVRLLERRKGPELAYFDDPLEAAFFSVLICMCREHEPDHGHAVPGGGTLFPELPSCHHTGKPSRGPGNRRV